MFCSVIIPTIGRQSVRRAVKSVFEQDFLEADYEVIVVNDSGRDLDLSDWPLDYEVTLIQSQKRERNFARNTGAAVARGEYLWFLDDDDWMLPGALKAMWALCQRQPLAVWFYGGIKIVDEAERLLAELNSKHSGNCFAQIMGGAWVPIQTSMVQADTFFQLGGFNPAIIGTEDLDLCRRFAYSGEFANTSAVVAVLQRGENWTTSTDYSRAEVDTWSSRDQVLSEGRAFRRLVNSAEDSYWFGRIIRVYLSTVRWNLVERRFFNMLSRLLHAFAWALVSVRHVISVSFWAGVRVEHVPGTLHYVMQRYETLTNSGDAR